MAGLLDFLNPELLSLLEGAGQNSQPKRGASLLGGAPPRATGFFAETKDDPRYSQNMALFSGIARRDVGGSMLDHAQFMAEDSDRQARRQSVQFGQIKSALELQQMTDAMQRDKSINARLAGLEGQVNPQEAGGSYGAQVGPRPPGPFGAQGPGSTPMFGGPGRLPEAGASPVPQAESFPPSASGAQQANSSQGQYQRMLQQARIYEEGGRPEMALKLLQAAQQFQPEFATEFRQVVDPSTGKLINVQVSKDGTIRPVPFGVKPDISLENLGGRTLAIDKNAAQGGQSWDRTMTPGETASNRVAQGNLSLSRERLALDRDTPQYMQTEGGLIALPKRPGAGPIVGRSVTDSDGGRIGPPLKAIPGNANTAIITNAQNLQRAQDALSMLKQNPDATGLKGYLPNDALNRFDPKGVDARAAIADLGSLVIHDRSGAAVTAAEFPRLAPFIPRATDDPATIEKKLNRFVQVYQQEAQSLGETYSKENGYRESTVVKRSAAAADPGQPQSAMAKLPTANASNRGRKIRDNETGKVLQSDGMAWKEVR